MRSGGNGHRGMRRGGRGRVSKEWMGGRMGGSYNELAMKTDIFDGLKITSYTRPFHLQDSPHLKYRCSIVEGES